MYGAAVAYSGLVEKQIFEMPGPFRTAGGGVVERVRVGFEVLGELDAARSNAILIPHPNVASSHVAGRYGPQDALPGYWDAIVGPGCPLDTDRYCLIGVDALCNPKAADGVTVTTGPSSIDPATGRPYGMRFPTICVRDLVEVQRAVLAHLGVTQLHAVIGASFGGMQTYEWAVAYPTSVARIVPVISTPWVGAYVLAKLRELRAAIALDPNWNGGDYYGGAQPVEGLTMALRLLYVAAVLTPEGAEASYARRWADPQRDPADSFDNEYAVCAWLDALARDRAQVVDANNFLYTQRANELFAVGGASTLKDGMRSITAKALVIAARGDEILPPSFARAAYDALVEQGNDATFFEIAGSMGHLDGVLSIAQAGEAIAAFLAR